MTLLWISQVFFWLSGPMLSYTMERKNYFYNRLVLCGAAAFLFTFFVTRLSFDGDVRLEITIRLVLLVLMALFLHFCWKMSKTVAVYNAMWAITIWQLIAECWVVISYARGEALAQDPLLAPLSMAVIYTFVYGICAKTLASWMLVDRKLVIGPRQMLSACLLFGIVEVLAMSPELRNVNSYHGEWRFLMVCQFICVVILYLQNELFKKQAMREELAMMDMLLKKEQEQYQMTRENIALINQKCHDMKHQIRALRTVSKEDRDKYLDELEDTIRIYEHMVKTGNEVLDTILTDKSLYCKDREILVSCVADGSQMDFINAIDLYAILGNALDNAIEAVEKFRNPDKRQIDVLIYRQQNFLVINIINPLEKKLVFDDDVPVTTKWDKHYHGFGIRSMKYLLSKYDGNLTINQEDGCFSLKMLIPIPAKS